MRTCIYPVPILAAHRSPLNLRVFPLPSSCVHCDRRDSVVHSNSRNLHNLPSGRRLYTMALTRYILILLDSRIRCYRTFPTRICGILCSYPLPIPPQPPNVSITVLLCGKTNCCLYVFAEPNLYINAYFVARSSCIRLNLSPMGMWIHWNSLTS